METDSVEISNGPLFILRGFEFTFHDFAEPVEAPSVVAAHHSSVSANLFSSCPSDCGQASKMRHSYTVAAHLPALRDLEMGAFAEMGDLANCSVAASSFGVRNNFAANYSDPVVRAPCVFAVKDVMVVIALLSS